MNENMKKEYAENVHEQVINWTNNCDTKTSILLALEGVLLSVFFTSDFVLKVLSAIGKNFITYWKNIPHKGQFDLLSLVIIISFVLTMFFIVKALWKQIKVLYPDVKLSEENEQSLIFFNSIDKMNIETYMKKINETSDKELVEDRINQIHICSQICAKKFSNYTSSIKCLRVGCVCIVVFYISIILW